MITSYLLIRHRAIFIFSLVIFVWLLMAIYSSVESASKKKLPVIQVCKDKRHCLLAEVAATPEALSRGLMSRKKLPEGRGMLFIFPRADFWHFWMKKTKIPLDIIWIDKARTIVFIAARAQPCLTEPCMDYIPQKKALYVLEIASGVSEKWGLKIGDRLIFEVPDGIVKKVR